MITKENENRIRISLPKDKDSPSRRVKSLRDSVEIFKGDQGEPGRGIKAIDQLSTDLLQITLTDDLKYNFSLPKGEDGKSITGNRGLKGEVGKAGKPGRGIVSITQPEDDIARVNYTDGTHDLLKLPRGEDGREIELRATATHVQWRYVGDKNWKNLYLIPQGDISLGGMGAGSLRVVQTLNGLYGKLTLSAGSNVVLTQTGNDIEISSSGSGGGGIWGTITGTLSNQTDLQSALNLKANIASLATVAFSGDHGDLIGLGDDDHPQYHNDARALTWLGTRSTTDLPEGSNLYFTNERVDDQVAALIQNGTGINWTYSDVGNTLTGNVTITQYTDEQAQDAVGAMIDLSLYYIDSTPVFGINTSHSNTWVSPQYFETTAAPAIQFGDISGGNYGNMGESIVGSEVGLLGPGNEFIAVVDIAAERYTYADGDIVVDHREIFFPGYTTDGFVKTAFGTGELKIDSNSYQILDAALTSLAGISWVQGDILYWSGVDTAARLAKDANATRYLSNQGGSNNPSWSQINLANGVTGDLPFSNITQLNPNSIAANPTTGTSDIISLSIAASRLVGRDATGNVSGQTVGGGLEFTTGGIQRSALTGDITATAGSGTTAIAAGVIVDADVNAAAAITATKLGNGDVDNTELSRLNGVTGAIYFAGGTDVAVADGGTGASTLTGILQGNGTSAFTAITNSTTVGQVLRVTGSNTYGWGALDLADTDAVTGTLPIANVAAGFVKVDGSTPLTGAWAANNNITGITLLSVDNITIDGNTVSSTNTNGNILLFPNGTGNVRMGITGNLAQVSSIGVLTFVGTGEYQIATNKRAFTATSAPLVGVGFYNTPQRYTFTDAAATEIFIVPMQSATLANFGYGQPSTTPGQITANQNDYFSGVESGVWRIDTDAARDITGIQAPMNHPGKHLTIWYIGANSAVFKHDNAGSAVANRILNVTAADITLTVGQGIKMWYDDVTLKWRAFKLA